MIKNNPKTNCWLNCPLSVFSLFCVFQLLAIQNFTLSQKETIHLVEKKTKKAMAFRMSIVLITLIKTKKLYLGRSQCGFYVGFKKYLKYSVA